MSMLYILFKLNLGVPNFERYKNTRVIIVLKLGPEDPLMS